MAKKCALVTGGSRGIGKAVCLKLAKDLQYHILVNYQSNENAALNTQKEIVDLGGTAEILRFDVANNEEVQTVLQEWKDKNPDAVVEVLVNNAGITRDRKSTRLNSSHVRISYAVFCLKKKKKQK